jgi:hypothetical protein
MKILKAFPKFLITTLFLGGILFFMQKAEAEIIKVKVINRSDNTINIFTVDLSLTENTIGDLCESIGYRLNLDNVVIKFNRQTYTIGDSRKLNTIILDPSKQIPIFVNSQNLPATSQVVPQVVPSQAQQRQVRVVGFTPSEIETRVNRLVELGFLQEDVEKALRAAQFNMDRAVDYLTSGSSIPEPLIIRIH